MILNQLGLFGSLSKLRSGWKILMCSYSELRICRLDIFMLLGHHINTKEIPINRNIVKFSKHRCLPLRAIWSVTWLSGAGGGKQDTDFFQRYEWTRTLNFYDSSHIWRQEKAQNLIWIVLAFITAHRPMFATIFCFDMYKLWVIKETFSTLYLDGIVGYDLVYLIFTSHCHLKEITGPT